MPSGPGEELLESLMASLMASMSGMGQSPTSRSYPFEKTSLSRGSAGEGPPPSPFPFKNFSRTRREMGGERFSHTLDQNSLARVDFSGPVEAGGASGERRRVSTWAGVGNFL